MSLENDTFIGVNNKESTGSTSSDLKTNKGGLDTSMLSETYSTKDSCHSLSSLAQPIEKPDNFN